MALTNAEGATLILHRIRDFLGKVVENPEYRENAPEILADLDQLEITIKRISEEALRP